LDVANGLSGSIALFMSMLKPPTVAVFLIVSACRFLLRKWVLAAVIMALPTCALAQVQSGLRSGLQSGLLSGSDHRQRAPEQMHRLHYSYTPCWRAGVIRKGVTRIWNCQPYPP
jgi:hypothetical protein